MTHTSPIKARPLVMRVPPTLACRHYGAGTTRECSPNGDPQSEMCFLRCCSGCPSHRHWFTKSFGRRHDSSMDRNASRQDRKRKAISPRFPHHLGLRRMTTDQCSSLPTLIVGDLNLLPRLAPLPSRTDDLNDVTRVDVSLATHACSRPSGPERIPTRDLIRPMPGSTGRIDSGLLPPQLARHSFVLSSCRFTDL